MATVRWRGGAPAVAQLNTYTFSGTWVIGELITVTYGTMAWSYAVTSATIATFLPLLETAYEALNASIYPAHAEQTADSTATTLTLTADTAGKPFTATISTNSALGLINGGASTTGTATTASSGPEDVSTAANWSGGAVPSSSDDAVIDDGTWSLKYGLSQSAITLTSLVVSSTFEGTIGLPLVSQDDGNYYEYRTDYWTISATNVYVGRGGGGNGSGRFKLNVGSAACTCDVYLTASGLEDDIEAFLFKGTSASNVLRVHSGAEVGVAVFGGETANLSGGVTLNPGAEVRCGSGVTLGAITNNGGSLEVNSAIATSMTQGDLGGSTVINGTGAVAALTVRGGYVGYNTTGTLGGNTVVTGNGVLDFGQDVRGKTVTNPIEKQATTATILDPLAIVNVGGSFVVDYNHCRSGADDLGFNVRLTRAATA